MWHRVTIFRGDPKVQLWRHWGSRFVSIYRLKTGPSAWSRSNEWGLKNFLNGVISGNTFRPTNLAIEHAQLEGEYLWTWCYLISIKHMNTSVFCGQPPLEHRSSSQHFVTQRVEPWFHPVSLGGGVLLEHRKMALSRWGWERKMASGSTFW